MVRHPLDVAYKRKPSVTLTFRWKEIEFWTIFLIVSFLSSGNLLYPSFPRSCSSEIGFFHLISSTERANYRTVLFIVTNLYSLARREESCEHKLPARMTAGSKQHSNLAVIRRWRRGEHAIGPSLRGRKNINIWFIRHHWQIVTKGLLGSEVTDPISTHFEMPLISAQSSRIDASSSVQDGILCGQSLILLVASNSSLRRLISH